MIFELELAIVSLGGRSMTQCGVAGAEARWAVEPQWKISIVV